MAVSYDNEGLRDAMRAYLAACDALAGAVDTAELLDLSDAKAIAGMTLSKRLTEAGWTAPVVQRTSS